MGIRGLCAADHRAILAPILKKIIAAYPFVIINFHSDNGSEFINKKVKWILNKLRVKQTKSRPGHSNDNGLVETKNNAVIRKEMGYMFIRKEAHILINEWYENYYNIFLNFYRPCGFATIKINEKGKVKRTYKNENYMTPYQKLKSIPNAENYLKPNITFANLDKIAYDKSGTEFTKELRKSKEKLFEIIKDRHMRDSILQDF